MAGHSREIAVRRNVISKICWYDGAECQPEQLEKELTEIDGIVHFGAVRSVGGWKMGVRREELTGLLMNRRKWAGSDQRDEIDMD